MTKYVSPLVALQALGYDLNHPCRGSIMIQALRNPFKVKHHSFRFRLKDGAVLARWGRIKSAEKQALSGLWIFHYDKLPTAEDNEALTTNNTRGTEI